MHRDHTKYVIELGKCFTFIGHQTPIAIDDNEVFIDML